MEELLKMSLIRNLQTDNILINTILTCLIISCTSYLAIYLRNIKYYLKKFLNYIMHTKTVKSEIEFTCSEVTSSYYGKKMTGSTSFKALLWLIKEKIKSNKVFGLKYLKEFNEFKDEYDDSGNSSSINFFDILYIVNQDDEFYFEDKNLENIYINFNKKEEDVKMADENRRNNHVTYNLLISSKKKDLKE